MPKWIAALPKGGASVSDKTVKEALKRFHEEEPDELKVFDYAALKAKDEEFRLIVAETSPADYSTHRWNAAKCLCREFVRNGFTVWHLRDFYAGWDGAGAHVDTHQHGGGEYNDRDIIKEFEGNKNGRPLTTGEALVTVNDEADVSVSYGKSEREVKRRLQVDVADLSGTEAKIVKVLKARNVEVYRRNDRLVRPCIKTAPKNLQGDVEGEVAAQLVQIDETRFLSLVSSHIEFLVPGAKGVAREISPPVAACRGVLANALWHDFREIVAVTGSPFLRPDGSIRTERGFDETTGVFLTESLSLPAIPEKPSRGDALRAVTTLKELLIEFPFVRPVHRSVALSALITPTNRNLFDVVPATAVEAPAPGSGKSYLCSLIGLLATGHHVPGRTAGQDEHEMAKRIDAALISGSPIVLFDNLNGRAHGDKLAMLISEPEVTIRILGRTEEFTAKNTFTTLINGNNLEISIDQTRRILVVRLDANAERPELRVFSFRPHELIAQDRGRYVAACIVILKAWRAAVGDGAKPLVPRLSSFEQWSDTVRSALVWLGEEDPCSSLNEARETNSDVEARRAILPLWHEQLGEGWYTAGKVLELASVDPGDHEAPLPLLDAIKAHLPDARRNETDEARFGRLLGESKGQVSGSLKLERGTRSNAGYLWRVSDLQDNR